jgi:chromosome partitioning protein
MPRRARVVMVGNQRGGVGKTTTALHVAASLAERGARVCMLDLDANHGLTRQLGLGDTMAGTFEALTRARPAAELLVSGEGEGFGAGLALLPGSRALEGLDDALRGQRFSLRCLAQPLDQLDALGRFDLFVLDTGPTMSRSTVAGYLEADGYLAAVRPDVQSMLALETVLHDIGAAQEENPRLRFLGALLQAVDTRTVLGRSSEHSYAQLLAGAGIAPEFGLLRTQIPHRESFSRAAFAGRTLFAWDPRAPELEQIREAGAELLGRMCAVGILGGSEPWQSSTPMHPAR